MVDEMSTVEASDDGQDAQNDPLILIPEEPTATDQAVEEQPTVGIAESPSSPRVPRTTQSHPDFVQTPPSKPTKSKSRRVPRARRMKLSVTKVDPWSVTKISLLLGIAFGIIQVIAVLVIYNVLDASGTFAKISDMVSSVSSTGSAPLITLSTVLSWTTIVSVVEIVLIVVLATVVAFLYNVVSALVGGVHVTLGDD
jgi:hypothetical protein